MISSRTSTNPVMAVMIQSRIVVKPDDLVHHRRGRLLESDLPVGEGCPIARRAPSAGKQCTDRHRHGGQPLEHQHRRHRSFDEAVTRPPRHTLLDRWARPERSVRHGRLLGRRAAGPWGIPASQTTIPGSSQCTSLWLPRTIPPEQPPGRRGRRTRIPPPISRPQCGVLLILTARNQHSVGTRQERDLKSGRVSKWA